MRKSVINLITQFKKLLLKYPMLVDQMNDKNPDFLQNLLNWIKETEELFISHNISKASELAGLRSKIIAPKFELNTRIPTRKKQLKVASEVLYDIQHVVLQILIPKEENLEENKLLIRQLLEIVSQSKALPYNPDIPFELFLENIWVFINNHDQLKAGGIKLKTNFSKTDIMILLAEVISLENF